MNHKLDESNSTPTPPGGISLISIFDNSQGKSREEEQKEQKEQKGQEKSKEHEQEIDILIRSTWFQYFWLAVPKNSINDQEEFKKLLRESKKMINYCPNSYTIDFTYITGGYMVFLYKIDCFPCKLCYSWKGVELNVRFSTHFVQLLWSNPLSSNQVTFIPKNWTLFWKKFRTEQDLSNYYSQDKKSTSTDFWDGVAILSSNSSSMILDHTQSPSHSGLSMIVEIVANFELDCIVPEKSRRNNTRFSCCDKL